MRTLISSNRYAVVTSTMALVIALGGGTAYAAALITSKDIKDGGVKKVDIAKNAVDSRRVADGSLLKQDFKAGQLPAGAQGPAGPQGPQGATGQRGPSGPTDVVYVRTGPLWAEPGTTDLFLFCPDGLSAASGGFASEVSDSAVSTHSSYPFDDNIFGPGADADNIPDDGWVVAINNDGDTGVPFAAYAVCMSATSVGQEHVIVTEAATSTRAGRDRILVRPESAPAD